MIQTNQSQASKKDRKKERQKTQSTESSERESTNEEPAAIETSKQTQAKQTKPQAKAKVSKEHAKMLEAFWKLSEYNQNTRLDGIQQIVKYFGDLDATKDKENYTYVLNRLVRGLASNRKCSRLGFSCCLTELLNQNESLSFENLIELAKANLKLSNDSTLTKEELRHMQIGLVFVYLCWIQSTRFDSNNSQNTLKLILTDLNSFRANPEFKVYIQQLYLQALCLLIKRLDKLDLVFNLLDSDLKQNFDLGKDLAVQKIKDNLNILLVCLNKSADSTESFLKSNALKLKSIFSAKNFDLFLDILSQSSESLPNLQPLCVELIQYLVVNNPVYFKHLWSELVDSKLALKKELEKKLVSFKLFLLSYNLLNKENHQIVYYESLLASANVLQLFVLNYTNKQANLSELFREDISKQLIEVVRVKEAEIEEASLGADLVIKILNYVRNYHDVSDLIGPLVAVLNKTSLNKLFDYFVNEFMKKDLEEFKQMQNEEETEKELRKEELISKETWLLNQLTNLAKSSSTFKDDALIKKILSYLAIHSYFDLVENGKKLDNFEIGLNLVKNEKLVNSLRERLIEYISVILFKNNQSSYPILIDLIESIKKLFDKKSSSVKLSDKLARKEQELNELSARMAGLLKSLWTKIENKSLQEVNKDVFETFFMCISIEFFRMFDSLKNTKQTLDDLDVCIQKFTDEVSGKKKEQKKKQKKAKKSQEDSEEDEENFEWIDVLVEMLLNLFTINACWVRNTVKNQFRKLIPKLTLDSVKLIVELLNPEADEELLVDEDEDNDAEEMEVDSEEDQEMDQPMNGDLFLTKDNSKNEEEESGVEDLSLSPSSVNGKKQKEDSEEEDDDDDDDDDEDEDEKSEVDPELKNKLLKALGNAVADEEHSEDSDLDDEAMLKLDEAIAATFKLKKRDKQRQTELMQYKLRALDLIQELFKSTSRLDLITYLIRPLLEILFESQTKPNLKSISQRILGFLMNIKNTTKKINESKLPSVEELFDLLSHLIQCSTIHFNVTNTLVETSMFCVRLIQHSANQCTDESEKNKILKKLTDIYMDIIKNDKSKINPVMYKEYLIRYPVYSIPLMVQMIDTASLPDVKLHKKTVTLITLYQCVNSQMFGQSVNSKNSDLFIEKIFKFFEQMIDDIVKDENLHIKFVDAFLNLVHRVLHLPKNLLIKELNEKLASKLTVFTKESKVKQAYKSRFMNLIQLCHRT